MAHGAVPSADGVYGVTGMHDSGNHEEGYAGGVKASVRAPRRVSKEEPRDIATAKEESAKVERGQLQRRARDRTLLEQAESGGDTGSVERADDDDDEAVSWFQDDDANYYYTNYYDDGNNEYGNDEDDGASALVPMEGGWLVRPKKPQAPKMEQQPGQEPAPSFFTCEFAKGTQKSRLAPPRGSGLPGCPGAEHLKYLRRHRFR